MLPVSAFGRNKTERDGLQGWCKKCSKAARKAKIQERRNQPLFCVGCQQTLPADQFPKRRPKKLYCNACRKARKAEYNQRFREEHRDELNAYLAEYRKTHEAKRPPDYNEKRAQSARERYANDPEYRAHVRALAANKRNAENRRRAREKKAVVELFDAEAHVAFLRTWQQGRCYYCGEPMAETHVEHIVPLSRNGAHSRQNTVLACPACNLSKGSKILWKEWVPPRTG
ncbi:MAG: HNH endonuclease signature motif containing protein, partial [Gammaproteobacteria bacterium]|nr:HNH endonuclease signature motif containing protein [Gammaproteobacteria bacterium]